MSFCFRIIASLQKCLWEYCVMYALNWRKKAEIIGVMRLRFILDNFTADESNNQE